MKIRVLGCHGSDQLIDRGTGLHQCRTCGFLINDTVMLDAGTIGGALTLAQQRRIRHVLLSHLHFDHIKGLPTLADNLVDDGMAPVTVSSIAEVLDGLQHYVFNDHVYPDFLSLPDPDRSVFVCRTLECRKPSKVDGLEVVPVRVNHLVPTVGFMLREEDRSVLYSGDTYETDDLWRVGAQEPTLRAVFIEASFPDEMEALARISKHLTPALLAREFKKLGRPDLPVYVYHLKPRFRDRITEQLRALGIAHLQVLEEGQEIVV